MTPSTSSSPDPFGHLINARLQAKRRMLGQMVLARDDERERIVATLHGAPLQTLSSVSARLEDLETRVGEDLQGEVHALSRSVQEAVGRLRRLTYDLSVDVAEAGLERAVEARVGRHERETETVASVDITVRREPSAAVRRTVLRILDEALANVQHHARAERLDLSVEADRGVLVRCEDDGVGFDPDQAGAAPSRMGLCVMRQRAETSGGWVRVDSAPGKGTIVECFIPHD